MHLQQTAACTDPPKGPDAFKCLPVPLQLLRFFFFLFFFCVSATAHHPVIGWARAVSAGAGLGLVECCGLRFFRKRSAHKGKDGVDVG